MGLVGVVGVVDVVGVEMCGVGLVEDEKKEEYE